MKLKNIKLQNFTELSKEKQLEILKWRNHTNVRKWMYSSDLISQQDHFLFIEKLKTDYSKRYFLVSKENEEIGVISFTNINQQDTYLGLYANPYSKIPGIGKVLITISIDYALNILKVKFLKLEVLSINEKAINLYKKFNFKEYKRKIVNNKEIICMELKL